MLLELQVIQTFGKSSIFNALTGMHQHTGNWPGKTVSSASGTYKYKDKDFLLIDIPGTYSLMSNSQEEEIARDFICTEKPDVMVIVVDSTCLERNLNLVYQILEISNNVVVCVNLLDEAEKKGITINLKKLSELLGVPVVGTIARKKKTLNKLLETIDNVATKKIIPNPQKIEYDSSESEDVIVSRIMKKANEITKKVCKYENINYNERDRKIDKILTSKKFGIPIMLAFLGFIFWLTIIGANYPSELLSKFFEYIQQKLYVLFNYCHAPNWLTGILIDGMFQTTGWVISVMLPPMLIFFPLFTLLEDLGYLPRIAFNMDKCFKKCCGTGKQALTMCMGFGCNAAGVVGCRIIDSPRERLIGILTNAFVPCNRKISYVNYNFYDFLWWFVYRCFFIFSINICSNFNCFTRNIINTCCI